MDILGIQFGDHKLESCRSRRGNEDNLEVSGLGFRVLGFRVCSRNSTALLIG